MDVTLLTPLGALIAILVVVPLVALALLHRRGVNRFQHAIRLDVLRRQLHLHIVADFGRHPHRIVEVDRLTLKVRKAS